MNLMMLLEMAASSFPERVAIQNGDDRLTFAELFAAGERALGQARALAAWRRSGRATA